MNTTEVNHQLFPSVAVLANGTQVVTWASNGQDGDGYGVYARLLDVNGQPLGGEFRVNVTTTLSQSNPSVTALGNGGFMIVWDEDQSNSQGNSRIYARHYDVAGNSMGSETRLATGGFAATPEAALLSDGTTIVVWTQPQFGNVYAQRFDANGHALTGAYALTPTAAQSGPVSVTAMADGGYALSWTQWVNQSSNRWDIHTQLFSANDTALNSASIVSTSGPYAQQQNMIASLTGGGYVVVSMAGGDLDGSGNGIFIRRYDALGQPLGAETRVNSYVTGDQQQPSVTGLADGGYIVAWSSALQDGSGYSVVAQRYDAAGGKVGKEFFLPENLAGDQVQPALTARPDGGFVAAWGGTDSSGYGIKLREFSAAGVEMAPYTTITGTPDNDTLTGSSNQIHIYGLDGNDSIIGGALDDLLLGGNGNDTIDGLDGSDYILGGDGDDRLTGNLGNDTLNGGAGNDTMFGGAGDDLYFVDNAGDVIRELVNEGVDEVRTTLNSYSLGVNLERLTFIGGGNFAGTGNALDNLVVGGVGSDTLTGGDGADTLIGGDGDDRFYFDAADAPLQGGAGFDTAVAQSSAGVSLDLVASSIEQAYGGAGNDSLTGTGALLGLWINGRDGDDFILGSAFNDTLTGGNGSDTLIAGDGDDVLYIDAADGVVSGGAGFDTVYVQGAGDVTLDLTASGVERVFSAGGNDTLSAVGAATLVEINGGDGNDWLVGSAFDDTLRGDAGDNTLYGGDGNDVLVGGSGSNLLFGGAGDDRLYVDTTTALLDGGDGDDIVYARTTGGVTLNVSASIEHFHGSIGNDSVTAVNALSAVEMLGGDGNDWMTGGVHADNLQGGNGDDRLDGGDGGDTLTGGTGNDTLIGGFGDDSLVGGAGADLFVFASGGGNDIVKDFNAAQGDRIGVADSQTWTVSTNARADAVITFGNSDTVTLTGVRYTTVSNSWFTVV
ncbi:calcium-binding protein [Azospirillum doebereinerae]